MKLLLIFSIFLITACSFDKKSGIWESEHSIKKGDIALKDFKTLSSNQKQFEKIIPIKKSFKFNITSKKKNNFEWKDIFFNQFNNLPNFQYVDENNLIFKSKRISRSKTDEYLLFENGNILLSDEKGNLIIYSIQDKKIIRKFNFYKKKYKKIKKKLNLAIDNEIVYVSDNFGYFYAYNYSNDKVLWAKNFKIPFRSNLKIIKNKIIAANQNNDLYYINIKTGDSLKIIPTEENQIKNKFVNNLSTLENNLFFLNTYGSLYSVNNKSMRINWFINLNQTIDLNPSNLFMGSQLIANEKNIIVSSNRFLYVLNNTNGSIIFKKNFSSAIKPIMIDDYLFLITKNNLLISLNLVDGEIIYSYDINDLIAKFYNVKKRKVAMHSLMILNDKIFLFLKNSYLVKFNLNGNIDNIVKLPAKLNTQPIVIDESIIYLNNSNKLLVIN